MNKRKTGSEYEDKAADLIVREGGRILDRNYRNRMGEIDIVADDAGTICFVEVKYRKNDSRGTPAEAVGIRKQFTICRVADHYRMAKRLSEDRPYRFDVIAITGDEIHWYKNAFSYVIL